MMERSQRLRPIDFHTLKQEVSVLDVLKLYDWQPTTIRRGGNELRGPCPVHGSKSENSIIFSVSPYRNAWKCFKCDAGGNQLDLAANYFDLPQSQSVRVAVALCRELGVEIPRLGNPLTEEEA